MQHATDFRESYLVWGIVFFRKQLNHYGAIKFVHYNVVHTISNDNRHTSVIASFQCNPISFGS